MTSITPTKIYIEQSVLARAKQNDRPALEQMFAQFLTGNEKIQFAEYMGQRGIVLLVDHNFACVTEKRIVSLTVGAFGEMLYQDAFLEDLNSTAIYQPSLFWLYVFGTIFVISTFGLGIFLIPLIVKGYYRLHKCGALFCIKQGISVFVFVNRSKLSRANVLWRVCAHLREARVALALKTIP
ncbi:MULTISPECIES: hypothetical protein [Niastella]|uniref:Uncharacterized protein n=1 Tax=Niastella soli TaxID=2821487 RepID=A0ABS3YTY1_9BACT|nr:hypothetical protein [Niastella soli]MBO9201027.1 hypothetical protein [Niastella soli]